MQICSGDAAQTPLGVVVVDGQVTIFQVARQRRPVLQRIGDGLAGFALGQHFFPNVFQILVQLFQHGLGDLLTQQAQFLADDGLQSLFIFGVPTLGRKLLMLSSVDVVERAGYGVSGRELIGIDEGFEEPTPDALLLVTDFCIRLGTLQ